jgi:hypothetical protein
VTAVWRYFDTSGVSCGTSREFTDRDDAEAWLGDSWQKLAASGIESVELIDRGDVAYRMELGESEQTDPDSEA